jgi:PPR repeat
VLTEYDGEVSASKLTDSATYSKLSRTIQFAMQLEEIVLQSQNPTNQQFESVVDAWIRVGQPKKADNIFQHIIDSNKLHLSISTYHVFINAFIQVENFSQALEILDAMETSPLTIFHPKTLDYNLVLAGYACHGSTYIHDAEQLLERIRRHNSPFCRPDAYSYSHFVDMLLLSGYQDIGDCIEDVLNQLDSQPHTIGSSLSRKQLEYQSIY